MGPAEPPERREAGQRPRGNFFWNSVRYSWWLVAGLPSSKPARANFRAPVHTDMMVTREACCDPSQASSLAPLSDCAPITIRSGRGASSSVYCGTTLAPPELVTALWLLDTVYSS